MTEEEKGECGGGGEEEEGEGEEKKFFIFNVESSVKEHDKTQVTDKLVS